MFASSIALAIALQAQPGAQPAAPVTVTPDNVDLDGAGKFDFTPDSDAFDAAHPVEGLSFTVRLWVDATGKPVQCDIDRAPAQKVAQIACAQLTSSAAFHIMPGMVAPLRRGFVDVQFSFYADTERPGRLKIFAFDVPGYRNVAIAYPPDQIAASAQLPLRDGNLAISVTADSYPPMAMRYELESASMVQLGVSRDGAIKSCRPISNAASRTAFLDNYTCTLFIRRGRFAFATTAPAYDGLRYTNRTMRWVLPR